MGTEKMGTYPQILRQMQIRQVIQFKVSLDKRCCSVFVGAGRWPARARRFDPQERRARLHLKITNARSAMVIDQIWNSLFVVVVAHATFPMLSRSGKQVVAIVSQSSDRAL